MSEFNINGKYYVTVTDIRRLFKCSHKKAKRLFETALQQEAKSGYMSVHDNKVALKTVVKLTGFDLNLYLKLIPNKVEDSK